MKKILCLAAALAATLGWLVHATKTASEPEPATTVVAEREAPARPRMSHFEAPAPAPVPTVAVSAAPEEPDQSIAGQRARLEDRFATETPDAAWASTAQQDLRTDLGRFATRDVGVRDVQCRASMCRIELALATRDAASEFMESWLRKRTWTGPGVADSNVIGADGQPHMVMFVGRDGFDL